MDLISIALAKKYTDSQIGDIATTVTEQVAEQIVDQVVEEAGDAIESAAAAAAAQEISGIIDSTLSTSGKAADAKVTGDEISDLKDQLDNISADAQTLSAGSEATATYTNGVIHLGIPRGNTGDNGTDGFSPTANVVKVGSTATITITDKNGTTTASISDGTGGGGGTSDYSDLTNKPRINNIELSGNKTASDLGIVAAQIVRW